MQDFFTKSKVQASISNFCKMLDELTPSDLFEKQRNEHLKKILNNMLQHSELWDKNTQVNIDLISDRLYDSLKEKNPSREFLDNVFSTCFRFLFEYYIFIPDDFNVEFRAINSFVVNQLDEFQSLARNDLQYALREMPTSILKNILHGEDFRVLRSFPSATKEAESLKLKWDSELSQRIETIKKLKDNLQEYQHAYNFAGLFKGFLELSNSKAIECEHSKKLVVRLGWVMMLPIALETFYFIFFGSGFTSAWDLLKITPAASLTLIIMYFFRIALKNYNSLKAQVLQIELRKTLCTFIQSYVDYSKEFKSKEHNPLDKFEDIIFSNIMTTDEKIPSTFDGVEQLASMISAFKGGRN